jgi:UDP-glucuronate decarboxylase
MTKVQICDIWHEQLFNKATPYLRRLEGCSILLTGMTGFFGSALLDLIVRYMSMNDNPATVYILTRDSEAFIRNNFALSKNKFLKIIEGDVKNFKTPRGNVDYVIHGASTSNSDKYRGLSQLERYDVLLSGSRHILDRCVHLGVKKILFISSGAVYGGASEHSGLIDETCKIAPDVILDEESCYSEGKRAAELMHILFAKEYGFDVTIARCFSFCGPRIPLDLNYAIGNFIKDALEKKPIKIHGDGTPVRAYMYTYDLSIWLLALLLEGKNCEAYNVGSEEVVTIKELAQLVVAASQSNLSINTLSAFMDEGNRFTAAGNFYAPNVKKAKQELGLEVWTSIDKTIRLTMNHVLSNGTLY